MKIPWVTILLIALAVVATFLITNAFGLSQKTDTKYFDLLMAEKDKQIEREKEVQKEIKAFYDPIIAESRRKDSLLAEKSKVNTIRYEKIPSTVRNYSNEELRGAVYDFEN